jgi:hypothetical protein
MDAALDGVEDTAARVPDALLPSTWRKPQEVEESVPAAQRRSSSAIASDEKTPFLSDESTKETRNKRKNRERTNAMAIDVLKLFDEGVRPLLNVLGHGARQHPLLCLLHQQL